MLFLTSVLLKINTRKKKKHTKIYGKYYIKLYKAGANNNKEAKINKFKFKFLIYSTFVDITFNFYIFCKTGKRKKVRNV